MTNPHDKAIEAAAESIRKCLEAIGAEAGTNTCHAIAQDAIAAYERAMWRPIEEAPLFSECEEVLIIGGRYEHITVKLSDGEWWKSQKGKIAGIPTHFRPLPPVPEGE